MRTARKLLLCLLAGLVASSHLNAEAGDKTDPAAAAIMLRAQKARSNWDSKFPGFTATIAVSFDGQRAVGTLTVSAAGDVELDVPQGPAAKWAREQLESIVMHRRAEAQDEYDVSFADKVTDHPLGRLIKFHGGSTHSLYRIRDDVITEVHRTLDKSRFTISVTEIERNAEGRVLPRHYNVSYWDSASGQLQSNNDFTEYSVRLGNYDLPQSRLLIRTANDLRQVCELKLSEHKLLK